MGELMGMEELRAGQERTVAPMGVQQGVQIMAARQEEVLLVADGHHKEVSGDVLAARMLYSFPVPVDLAVTTERYSAEYRNSADCRVFRLESAIIWAYS